MHKASIKTVIDQYPEDHSKDMEQPMADKQFEKDDYLTAPLRPELSGVLSVMQF